MPTPVLKNGQTRTSRNWETRLREVEGFIATTGSFPRANCRRRLEKPTECRLADWLRRQRRSRPNLSSKQSRCLEALPGFEWEPRDAAWDDKFFAYGGFLELQGRPPRRRSDDAVERSLAVWFRNQCWQLAKGTLPKHRADELDRLKLPPRVFA